MGDVPVTGFARPELLATTDWLANGWTTPPFASLTATSSRPTSGCTSPAPSACASTTT